MKDPVSGLTHLAGALVSIAGTIILLRHAKRFGTPWHTGSFATFGVSLVLLYGASAAYHLLDLTEQKNRMLRTFDHMMIYVLIAGTYTPICLIALSGTLRWVLFLAIWGCALAGILTQGLWFNAPRWLSTSYYIVMGWLGILAILPLWQAIGAKGIAWMLAGGVSYTLGGIIYALKLPRTPWKGFGFHEIFHLFVLGGSFCHYWMVLVYIASV
jgi:hemolysin III